MKEKKMFSESWLHIPESWLALLRWKLSVNPLIAIGELAAVGGYSAQSCNKFCSGCEMINNNFDYEGWTLSALPLKLVEGSAAAILQHFYASIPT